MRFRAAVLAVVALGMAVFVQPTPAGAHGKTACTATSGGANYALNAGAYGAINASRHWTIDKLDWQYLSSRTTDNPDPAAGRLTVDRKNNIVIQLVDANDGLRWAYVGPDSDDYGMWYTHGPMPAPTAPENGKWKLYFTAAFDRPGDPDPHCTAVLPLDGPNGVCVGCPITTR